MNKQELNNFLDKNINEIGNFALVTFDNKTIPIYFSRQNYNGEAWFMENPCEVYKFDFPKEQQTDENIKKYCNELYECETEEDLNNIIKYTKSMIRDSYLYKIEVPQIIGNIIPNNIDYIKIISKSECLDFILKENN